MSHAHVYKGLDKEENSNRRSVVGRATGNTGHKAKGEKLARDGRRAVEAKIASVAAEAIARPYTWTDVSEFSDCEFLALLRQGTRGR